MHIITSDTIVAASKDQVSCDLAGEAAILNLRNSGYYGLDEIGACIWHLIEDGIPVSAVRDAIVDEYDVDPEECEQDVIELLQRLAAEGLVEIKGETAP